MDWQLIAVGVLVTLATLYVARATWKTWAGGKPGCGGGCACPGEGGRGEPAAKILIASEDVKLRRR